MVRTIILVLSLAYISNGNVLAQNKNRVSLQTGLFHCFFDKSPLLNTNYKNKGHKPFNGLFYNSLGLQYQRIIGDRSSLSVEYMYFYEYYMNVNHNLLKKQMFDRNYNTFNITYDRHFEIKPKLRYTTGIGLNCRYGVETVAVNYHYFAYPGFYEILTESRFVGDLGINIRSGIEYTPFPWLTLFSKLDCIGFVYLNNKRAIERLQDGYGYKKYPHRFDLSWRFGIGFNF